MLAGRRYRLEFDFGQRVFAERLGGICRSVWNTGLEQRRAYRLRGAHVSYVEQCAQLAEAKKDPYCGWLSEAPAQAIQQTLKDLDQACRRHGTWKVGWRSRARWKPSFRFPSAKHLRIERVSRKWGRALLPKFGWVRFRMSRPLGGRVRSVTVSRDGRHWFIAFLVEDGLQQVDHHPHSLTHAGVDRGVVSAAVTSDGEFLDRRHAGQAGVSSLVAPPERKRDREADRGYLSPGEAERHLRLQRHLARSAKGSQRRKRVVAAIGDITRRVRDRRADFNAQAAHRLTKRYGVVVLEDLNLGGMTAAAKPKPEPGRPGRYLRNGAAAKSGLNRAILDKGWYGLEVALRSKARYTGTTIAVVPASYTSQTCPDSACGVVDATSRESQAAFRCTACGHTEHADIVGAKNIKARYRAAGPAVPGRGDPPGPAKRQASRSRAPGRVAARAAAQAARESPPPNGEQVNFPGKTGRDE